ncbi:ABC transporter ATP-binding protein/permease [Chroococcus sp. FPU101]|uniref:ABC transporter ATP-binding protein/permease n=1 Tax=Chroococcus sp. FPU101 TaxID=1974212 RepID=UPI001A90296C|nr:ABC transporter ATP-binding protein/permease [Chroococcus sp. FPU101]GFE67422.1 ATP-binding protein of ABC transporter [Chroococcus sp. FPU101]
MLDRSERQWLQIWKIARFYWFSPEKWQARGLLLLLLILSLGSSSFLVIESLQRGEIISSLAAKDPERFSKALGLFLGLILIGIPLLSFNNYVQGKLGLNWRRWLTHYFINQYLEQQTFYQIGWQTEIDNPDQRIAEDLKIFTQQSLYFFSIFVDSLLQLSGFVAVLWFISKPLMFFLIIYALVGTVVIFVIFGKILTRLNFEQFKLEGNFRFGLIRVRENAESIAFYHGQTQERKQAQEKFRAVFQNFHKLIRWQFNLNVFQNGYQYINFILPFIVLAPRIFSGELEVGAVSQSQAAFERIGFALGLMINQFDKLTLIAASVRRLSTLKQAMAQENYSSNTSMIELKENTDLTIKNLTLITPNTQTILVQKLSIPIPLKQSLLIVGASGVGKSSLLRAIAGLWHSGSGVIERPKREEILFLPQKPYMILGTLRQQLMYPKNKLNIDDQQLYQLLEQVNLAHLIIHSNSLDHVEDWSNILSLGEQQRLAFARLLITKPKYAILDESTSALDINNEARLYQQLQGTSLTYVSVGHRPTLIKYHQQVLELAEDHSWCLSLAENYRFN